MSQVPNPSLAFPLLDSLLYLHYLCKYLCNYLFTYSYSFDCFIIYVIDIADDAKCIVVTRVCVPVSLSVCLPVCLHAHRPHYLTDPDVT